MINNPTYGVNWTTGNYNHGFKKYAYQRLHLPSGGALYEEHFVYCQNEEIFHRLINDWNREGGGKWKYYH